MFDISIIQDLDNCYCRLKKWPEIGYVWNFPTLYSFLSLYCSCDSSQMLLLSLCLHLLHFSAMPICPRPRTLPISLFLVSSHTPSWITSHTPCFSSRMPSCSCLSCITSSGRASPDPTPHPSVWCFLLSQNPFLMFHLIQLHHILDWPVV